MCRDFGRRFASSMKFGRVAVCSYRGVVASKDVGSPLSLVVTIVG